MSDSYAIHSINSLLKSSNDETVHKYLHNVNTYNCTIIINCKKYKFSKLKHDILKALYDFGLVDPEKWNEESLQRLCGILDVNTFEIRCPAGTSSTARALFPLASLMSHDCTPNAHITLDKKHHIRSFASRDIAEGTTICCTYTSIMQVRGLVKLKPSNSMYTQFVSTNTRIRIQ